MIVRRNERLANLLQRLPGRRFGVYRILPLFFFMGAALEYTMIHWHVGEVNFYRTYKKKMALDIVLKEERLVQSGQARALASQAESAA
eukprot:maker-scaffold671_size114370-snap-gene-0.30 protein:Tk06013 transcript:maker-scaffold671_size114370-snap-gene-0.30-mRNA-1 annotation:"AGAP009045-PA"